MKKKWILTLYSIPTGTVLSAEKKMNSIISSIRPI